MKKFKKAIVALLAMTMALGMLTVAAKADEVTYYVVGSGVGQESDWDCNNAVAMTEGENGVWTYTIESDGTAMAFKIVTEQGNWDSQISMGGGTNGGNIEYTPDGAGKYTITLDTTKIGANNEADEAVTVAAATDAPAGVSTPVVIAAIAVVSMVGIVVFTKRRTVAE